MHKRITHLACFVKGSIVTMDRDASAVIGAVRPGRGTAQAIGKELEL